MVDEALFEEFKRKVKKYEKNIQKNKEQINRYIERIFTLRNEMFFNGRELYYDSCGYDHIPVYKITYDGLGGPDDIMTVCTDCMKRPEYNFSILKKELL